MTNAEKERLIKSDILSIESQVRHAFNQGYNLGYKDGLQKPETVTEFADRCRECGARNGKMLNDMWIPVNEKLPEENKTVIASTDYCIYPEARYTEKCGWEGAYESGADYWVKIKDVIAWMSLPKHYEPQESEG